MGTSYSKKGMGKVEVKGSQRQTADVAVALHRSGKKVAVHTRTDLKYLHDYREYDVAHRDTKSLILRDDGTVHVTLTGDEVLIVEGEEKQFE